MKTSLDHLDKSLPFQVKQLRFDDNVFKLALVRMSIYSHNFFVYLDLEKKYYLFSDQHLCFLQIKPFNKDLEFVDWA